MSHTFGVRCRTHNAVMMDESCPEPGCNGHHGYMSKPCDVRCPDRPCGDGRGYRKATGKTHLPDEYLPAPRHNWTLAPWGWTVNTLCGLVLRRAQPVTAATNLCGKCARRAIARQSPAA